MKLSKESLKNTEAWEGYHLPQYDIDQIVKNTEERPQWMHFGPGNIFRIFPAALCQELIEKGEMDTGIVCVEGYDEEVITKCYQQFDNLTVAVTLHVDGSIDKEVIGSCAEAYAMLYDADKVAEIIKKPSLQMISFTITEKGYSLRNAAHEIVPAVAEDMENGPENCKSFMAQLTSMVIGRYRDNGTPLALVSMDNCSHNGEKLQSGVMEIAEAWLNNGKITQDEYDYLCNDVSFPWTMIDKITPRPNPVIQEKLEEDGLEDMEPIMTAKHSYTAAFVNSEESQYLVIEDDFPNGRPPLQDAGVIFTDRETVNKIEKMKVGTCLNPLHTCLAIYGCLLGYDSIAAEMQDPQLPVFIDRMSHEEGMPFVVDPGVINPEDFLNTVLTVRLPNSYMPDTPQRIAMDTSQKIPVRYGETIKSYIASPDYEVTDLNLIPLVLAGYLRYLMGVDDNGDPMECSPDPLLDDLQAKMAGIKLGEDFDEAQLEPILSDDAIFGVNLYDCGLADKVISYFKELQAGPGAVRATLEKYIG